MLLSYHTFCLLSTAVFRRDFALNISVRQPRRFKNVARKNARRRRTSDKAAALQLTGGFYGVKMGSPEYAAAKGICGKYFARDKKMFIKIAAGVVAAAVILFAIVYVLYVVLQYRRIEDEKTLEIENPETEKVRAKESYIVGTYNIGFGAYDKDFSFFHEQGAYA